MLNMFRNKFISYNLILIDVLINIESILNRYQNNLKCLNRFVRYF